ncbi:ThuA domain-containing protein [Candidatus Laterigemmans baculatus]|uniref:ThuA domain-containing protein n=1 Tax=Candidatus Laterigemmans baculatus TaxID=2770505 RepID=UPI0013DA1EB4|nr:ThuA domain-containing protein [Candidatus Laterigemmans baculatus]
MPQPIRVTVWNEFVHEREREDVRKVYPDGLHQVIAEGLRASLGEAVEVRTATLDEPEHGLPEEVLQSTDVLLWWGHAAHDRVDDEVVARVHSRVLDGMGLLVLHSGHGSKIFRRLMGTSCMLRWREAGERERLWVVDPSHPILDGLGTDVIEIEQAEMYGEFFDIPAPDELLMISSFAGGEVFRSGCTFRRGKGKIFYFRPGHELYPIYYHPQVRQVIAGGVRWAVPSGTPYTQEARHCP